MAKTTNGLIIVESPSKAKTLKKFLGDEYSILASVGHIRDLPKKELGVDIENGFKPKYVASQDKTKVISQLKSEVKNAETLYIATDPDREGEAIAWHLIEILKPSIPVNRLVFHEITKTAIQDSFTHTRDIDQSLVGAQEARRILDRLWGYQVSEKLWYNVKGGLSAGRVQSPAVKIIVDREKERSKFKENEYWSINGEFGEDEGTFQGRLINYDGQKIATGKDFDRLTGTLQSKNCLPLNKDKAEEFAVYFKSVDWSVSQITEKPSTQNPYPPFITSTLQQEGIRKLRMSSRSVMITAQKLYEDGYITYMRTDSVILSNEAIQASRKAVEKLFGLEYLPDKPRQYKSKVKNAQEAHEAIRPAGSTFKHPDDLKNILDPSQWKLYNMIWKRTIACQMKSAKLMNTTVEITGNSAIFNAKGKVIEFPGFLKVYVEDIDDPNKEKDDKETTLPKLTQGQNLKAEEFTPNQHFTKASPRYTEASLVKELESLGIGRPSTYSAIMENIQRRGYVHKLKGALVPTFTAYAVVQFLEKYFTDLVNLRYTAEMEDTLDEISRSEMKSGDFLNKFYFGSNGNSGLKFALDSEFDKDFSRTISELTGESGNPVTIKIGRYGVYIQQGDTNTTVPDDFIPSELDYNQAIHLLEKKTKGPVSVFIHPESKEEIHVKDGRFGPYLQCGKKMKSLLPGMTIEDVTEDIAIKIISLPREVGMHPETGEKITADIGRYGTYIRCGKKTGKVTEQDNLLELTLERAVELLNTSSSSGGTTVIRELGKEPESDSTIELKDGRYGMYVTDGKINATLPKDENSESLELERALELIAQKRARGPVKRRNFKRKAK